MSDNVAINDGAYAMSRQPVVSIGLPVYNGEGYLQETIECVLGQTFADLELIISDNASTDATAEICRRFAARDPRVHYSRNQENLGASRNYNITFELGRGRYFKWQGHDDPIPPTYLERCVAVLDRDPTVVLAYGKQCPIDEHGRPKRTGALVAARLQGRSGLASRHAFVRYLACVAVPVGHPVGPIFGVIRREALRRTPLLGAFVSHDLPLTAELALHGRFHQLPDIAQFRRYHAGQGHRTHRTLAQRESWFDPARDRLTTHPRVRLLREHMHAIRRATRHPGVRASCYVGTLVWFLTEVLGIRPAKSLFRGLYQRFKPAQAADESSPQSRSGT
jgi:glycosyltransferase involved in cell wall biosynthesis